MPRSLNGKYFLLSTVYDPNLNPDLRATVDYFSIPGQCWPVTWLGDVDDWAAGIWAASSSMYLCMVNRYCVTSRVCTHHYVLGEQQDMSDKCHCGSEQGRQEHVHTMTPPVLWSLPRSNTRSNTRDRCVTKSGPRVSIRARMVL